MEEILICVCIIVMLVTVGALIVVLAIFLSDRKNDSRAAAIDYNSTVRAYSPNMVIQGSETAYSRVWEIQLWNQYTNQLYKKRFSSQVILGRYIPGTELFWQMRLDDDPTISREQCVVYDRGGFLVIENISSVNPTLLNGNNIASPVLFQQGGMLTMGNISYYVSSVRRLS